MVPAASAPEAAAGVVAAAFVEAVELEG